MTKSVEVVAAEGLTDNKNFCTEIIIPTTNSSKSNGRPLPRTFIRGFTAVLILTLTQEHESLVFWKKERRDNRYRFRVPFPYTPYMCICGLRFSDGLPGGNLCNCFILQRTYRTKICSWFITRTITAKCLQTLS